MITLSSKEEVVKRQQGKPGRYDSLRRKTHHHTDEHSFQAHAATCELLRGFSSRNKILIVIIIIIINDNTITISCEQKQTDSNDHLLFLFSFVRSSPILG